ncbi:histone deacetylase 2 isoform X1 [Momordica charantia]|uniref:Histone deacetylase 2 isoform X1 n=1 Tax=Momordica charantia TaxID=3673 RepID=A0A6J1CG62_MOMCH|nr:histone deacetylase 2 isoform X1 [Momordica charantia]XP_022140210.1 histone deacetylase 2 isoform X1 [Momordica charantia]
MSSSSSPENGNDPETARRDRILSTKLYFDVPSSKVPVIYSSSYDISFLGIEKLHPFDSKKWRRVCQFLVAAGVLRKDQIVEPLEAKKNDLLVVHPQSYLDSLKNSLNVAKIIEVPPVAVFPHCIVKNKVQRPFRNQVGGTILAAKLAKERGWAINVGGGFHHCSAELGGGFCVYADISLCIHYAFVQLNISRVMIIDLDAHQGNGHEMDFAHDSMAIQFFGNSFQLALFRNANVLFVLAGRVYILDMFNPGIYPFDYEARRCIDQKVEVDSGTKTSEYLKKLEEALEIAATSYDPDLIVYNAGTDILDGDPLGLLKISAGGIAMRDEKVFKFARTRNIPIVMLTSGGYMKSSAKVIADSIENLSKQSLIDTGSSPG